MSLATQRSAVGTHFDRSESCPTCPLRSLPTNLQYVAVNGYRDVPRWERTMGLAAKIQGINIEDYLEGEEVSQIRHECLDGVVHARVLKIGA